MAGMGRSSSTPALQTAGSGVLMSHIPKKAVQHGMYVSSWEVPPAQLKPGQFALERQLYSEEAKDHEDTYMETELPPGSVYQKSIVQRLQPSDYYFPRKAIRQSEPADGGGHHGTAHWKSEYRSNVNDAARFDTVLHRQNGPSYQVANPPTCVSGGDVLSTATETYGKHGSNPRHKFRNEDFDPSMSNRLPSYKSALTVGTTKGTAHIPGYQGFMATNTANAKVAAITHGGTLRTTDKSNLTEAYHTNIVGYSGHKPRNALNDRGGVSINNVTTMGRAFQHPPPSSYDV